jgi:hypothetical protein
MADLFKPDPEHPQPAPGVKPPPPAWVTGCKSGLLTVLSFFFLLVVLLVTIGSAIGLHHHMRQLEEKMDRIQTKVDELKQKSEEKK